MLTCSLNLGGLIAGYGSDSDSEEEDAKEASDDSDSDEELLKRMLEKKRAFAVKEKQMISDQPGKLFLDLGFVSMR